MQSGGTVVQLVFLLVVVMVEIVTYELAYLPVPLHPSPTQRYMPIAQKDISFISRQSLQEFSGEIAAG